MKCIMKFSLLTLFCLSLSANADEKSLDLVLKTRMRTLRMGQSAVMELKIVGSAINEIMNDTEGIDPSTTKVPSFIYEFTFKPQREGEFTFGPYSLSFNGEYLVSNSLTIDVLPQWDGNLGTFYRVDSNDISFGDSIELVMETWSKDRKRYKVMRALNNEHFSIVSGHSMYSAHTTTGEETHYSMKSWIITPKSKGEFLITEDIFSEFPEDVMLPQIKIQVR